MKTPPLTALTVGHVTHDRFGEAIRAGGGAFYGARTFAALGAGSRLVTSVGTDFERRDELAGLEASVHVAGSTTTFENSYDEHGGRRQRVENVGALVTPDGLPTDWSKADIVFLAPVIGELDLRAWLDAVDSPLVGLGLQGLLKGPGTPDPRGGHSVTAAAFECEPDILARLSAVFVSEEDLAHQSDLLADLRRCAPIVVVTLGEKGSRLFTRTGEWWVGTFPTSATDPTGAGDSYAAAFLFALSQKASPLDAARLASAAASIVVEGEGGTTLGRLGESRARVSKVGASETATTTRAHRIEK